MKSLNNINELLKTFEAKYKIPIVGAEQQSEAWFQVKLGVLSASNASKILAKKGTDTRNTYMCELVAQVCTGLMEEINNKYVNWGNQHEEAARSSLAFELEQPFDKIPFVFKDASFRVGASPDSINPFGEIKCPFNSVHYVKFLCDDKLKPEYVAQNQFQIWVCDTDSWLAAQYDPRMKSKPLHHIIVKRDEETMKAFDDLVPAFIQDMDAMLKKAGASFGDQWLRIAEKQAVA
jgi:hypothetical protein